MGYSPAAPRVSFWEKLADVHHAIRYGNGQLQNVVHPASSPWYTWPIMKHPIALWEGAKPANGSRTMVILLGNPVVWWGGMIGALIGLLGFALRPRRFAGIEYGVVLLTGAALLNYVPFAAIRRVMYLYHYLFALVVLVALASLSAGAVAGWMADDDAPWRFPSRRSALIYAAVVALMVTGFVYFLPFTYGWTLSASSWDTHFWVLHPTLF
jgi:dolichyl-phosphate-mannose--protein O-mannosyl transferase